VQLNRRIINALIAKPTTRTTRKQKLANIIPHWTGTALACTQSWKSTGKIRNIEMGIKPITKNMDDRQPQIKCIQFNVNNSKTATANLMKIINEDKTDMYTGTIYFPK
jgi:hypothetical protein